MEFWGVEVKAGQSLKVRPEYLKLIHISQAALGEVKDGKGPKNVPLRLKVDGKDFVIGSLAAEERSQLAFDLVFEKGFELSHGWKDGSVHFLGYTADDQVSDGEISSDDCPDFSSDKDVPVAAPENGHAEPKSVIAEFVKNADAEDDDSDSDDEENEDDDSEDEDDESSEEEEEEEELPQMQAPKKRDAESPKDAAPAEKAEQDSEEEDESSEEEEEVPRAPKKRAAKSPKNAAPAKKATPEQKAFPAKTAGKGQQAGHKSKGKTGKAGGRK